MKKKVVYLTQWIARDRNKEYPHGYGFIAPIVDFPQDKDPAWVAQQCRDNLSNDEFECIGATAMPLLDGMFEVVGELPIDGILQDNTSEEMIKWLTGRNKPHFVDKFRQLLNLFLKEEISMSKFVEELNITAIKWHLSQAVENKSSEEVVPVTNDVKWSGDDMVNIVIHFYGNVIGGYYDDMGERQVDKLKSDIKDYLKRLCINIYPAKK